MRSVIIDMLVIYLAYTVISLAVLSAVMISLNWPFLRKTPKKRLPLNSQTESVSVLIPARNEAENIAQALDCVLANQGVELEVIVLDDDSTDTTAEIIQNYATQDNRVHYIKAPALPAGFNGKQHACAVLATQAQYPWLLFIDADVHITADAIVRTVIYAKQHNQQLVSGFPKQKTTTWLEKIFIPLMHFLFMGYLPLIGMKLTKMAGFGAGCGQFLFFDRQAYETTGGHQAIIQCMHDGLALPRLFRKQGYRTDVADITDICECHMYDNWQDLWNGFSKNATEGMAKPIALPIWTLLLFGGHVLPYILLPVSLIGSLPVLSFVSGLAIFICYVQRLTLAIRFQHALSSILWHPVAILLLLVIQWVALFNAYQGKSASWRDRAYPH